ncbi:hypothetical protein AB0E63_28130 [Kribbella sp. NPDC026596]|uniref:hypothetical protein n=1 Tax=Kribbella sp. NPDC026596 TaxID=3155122 RepID=UPI0033ED38D5
MNILSGWREQYDRMIRSRDQLIEVATGSGPQLISSDHARDALLHFYMDAYHLKDWIGNDPAAGTASTSVEDFVKATATLRLCADLANGAKHLKLTSTKTGDMQTGISSQSIIVQPGTVRARATVNDGGPITATENVPADDPMPALHSWEATSAGKMHDLVALADDVVATWTAWLQQQHLL